ncbi:MAG TPA: glycoside hydrolase family 44 protein [Thermoleophilaceae bacterium]
MRGLAVILVALALPAAAAADPGPALSVDAGSGRHAISPYIYGWNFAPSPLGGDIDLPVDRRGGNKADTINWQTGFENTGGDYFFENIPWCWSGAYGYCGGPNPELGGFHAYTDQIGADRDIGAKTLIDLPMLGYVPKDPSPFSQPLACSFLKGEYPGQTAFDPYDPNCGNGKSGPATWITNTPERDDAQAAGAAFQGGWIEDLKSRYGTAANGGVAFYELGNEPGLWHDTHHDWHPDPVTYDELWSKSQALASEVKSRDPSAAVLAFSEWGWPNYFCSSQDNLSNGCQATDTDRNAHGGSELAAWLLQQFKQWADDHGGERLIDYLDLHYYRQGGAGIGPTRSLWDPSFTDPSWINDTINLLPRMHDWVDQNYPGTKISLSEYDLSNGDTEEDNLIQADVLGIFARERLDLATLWPLEDQSHYADAFRLFRNYDGARSKFGDTYVSSQSDDQSTLAIYGAQRSSDGSLTLVVVNKGFTELTSSVALAGFTPAGTAQTWRWTSTAGGITRGADLGVNASGFSASFAPRSMTMVVIPPPAPSTTPSTEAGGGGGDQTPTPTANPTTPAPAPAPAAAPTCKVPKLIGLTLTTAKAKLKKAHCRLGKVTKKRSEKRKGRVIGQKPKRGAVRRSGTRVSVVLSRGR